MNNSAKRNLSHISFAGKTPTRRQPSSARGACGAVCAAAPPAAEERLDEFIAWVLGRAGLDATAYRTQSLHRRLPACLRTLNVPEPRAAGELVERKPHLVATVISSLLIGATEFFREPGVFDCLGTQVLPALANCNRRLRIWSAACSSGAELYSMAILLREAGLLETSYLLGTDCRGDAIDRAKLGFYDATMLKLVPAATRDKYFEPVGPHWRPVEALRRQVHWKAADLLAGVEDGPWDIIFWRNAAIYLKPCRAETIWRQLASVLAPGGVLIAGKAERPPADAGLTHAARCVYRVLTPAGTTFTRPVGRIANPSYNNPAPNDDLSRRENGAVPLRPLPRSIGRELALEHRV
ncbi:MAG: protein-glutamate O-methyltransferase CheR [Thermoguttaceae bacterium]